MCWETPWGQKVDVHCYTFDADEKNVYGIRNPAESLTGTGSIEGYAVRCISAEWVVKFHTQYEPDEKDFKDVYAVCAKFGIAVPAPKAGRLTGKWNPPPLTRAQALPNVTTQ